MSDYDFVSGGSLKLKNKSSTSTNGFDKKGKKKKRGTKKDKQQGNSGQRELVEEAPIDSTSTNSGNEPNSGKRKNDGWMTEAQKKFKKQQDKFQMARIISKATKSHKQRVEEFNAHLEGLSEHYDIPKVSWTKWTQSSLLEGCIVYHILIVQSFTLTCIYIIFETFKLKATHYVRLIKYAEYCIHIKR